MVVLDMKPSEPDRETRSFYRQVFRMLDRQEVPYLVGGAYALARYAGIARHTKDIDVFVRASDVERALEVMDAQGCWTDLTFPHWLAKAGRGDACCDVIFNSGNGLAAVDEEWFEHAIADEVVGIPVLLCPPEEMIWQKSFIMERERFDGADIAHLLRAQVERLDWKRMFRRFAGHERVLLTHLLLFGYIYPSERMRVPDWVFRHLFDTFQHEQARPVEGEPVCQGTFLSRAQYLADVQRFGYQDARLTREGPMNERDVAHWTAAIGDD
jgi:hypothetical protein